MNINIETNTVQNTSSEELDLIAKELCGVKLSLADSGIPAYLVQSVSEEGIVASTVDGVHTDTRDALSEVGITVLSLNTYLRILDPEVKRVLIETVGLGSLGNITTEEFSYLTGQRLGNAFKNNSLITNFDEIKYTAITELTLNEFYGCSNLKSIDLSNITKVGYRVFYLCKVFDFGDISNLIAVSNGAISLSLHEKYKNLTLPNLDRTYYSDKFINYYNNYLVPESTEFFYAPNCTSTAMRPTGINLKYAYFPKVQDFGAKLVSIYDGKGLASNNTVLNILSIGEDVLYVRGTIATYTTNPNACMVIHANSFELLDGLHVYDDLDNDKANGALYKNTFVVDYNAIPTRFKKIDTHVCEIGYEDWKQRMQMFSEDREYTIPDQYTDFYYDYIDYMLGGIPLPDSLMSNPSIIEIHAERIGKLSDNDEICRYGNSINLKVYVNSYKNASTLELIENNAGATLNGRVLTIPSTANGETITLRATNIYNTSLTTQVTVKIYDYRLKYIEVEPLVYDRLSWASSDGQGLTMQDLLGITDFPPSLFCNSNVSNFDMFQYTSVQSIPSAYCWKAGLRNMGSFQGSTLLSICFPQTLTTIGSAAFSGCKSLTNVTIPNTIISIPKDCFEYCTALTSVSIPSSVTSIEEEAFLQCDSLLILDLPGIVTINCHAFIMSGIKTLNLGPNVLYVQDDDRGSRAAFATMLNLTTFKIEAVTPPTLTRKPFSSSSNLLHIYVPASSVNAYKAATGWSEWASIIEAIPTT